MDSTILNTYAPLLAGLAALLLGLAIGKAWERYKLRDGKWIDRRRIRGSHHYLLGLNFLVSNQVDVAIEELSRAAADSDALETHLILGNLYREKGQVARAITLHQGLLQRPRLSKLEHAYVLLCLGLDYRRAGFVDRALETFTEVLKLDPANQYALAHLEKLHADQHQWEQAYEVRKKLIAGAEPADASRNDAILAFIENELGLEALKRLSFGAAAARFRGAIDLDQQAVPAYLNLGDVKMQEGEPSEAVAIWERLVSIAPERAYLTFDRLEAAYRTLAVPGRFPDLCRNLIAANPQDWRARLALSRHLTAQSRPQEALDLLFEALEQNPHALSVHQAIWQVLLTIDLPPALVQSYVDLTRHSIFYLDPHVCVRCRYRSTELLWQCPHCHEWNTFVEERMAPAKEPVGAAD
jgi:lipopolysaccharide biosynthesis regulator YciM